MFGASLDEGGYLVLCRTEVFPEEIADPIEPVLPAERIDRLRAGG